MSCCVFASHESNDHLILDHSVALYKIDLKGYFTIDVQNAEYI